MRQRFAAVALPALMSLLCATAGATAAPQVVSYIDSALAVMRANSLRRKTVDWDRLRQETLVRAADAWALDGAYLPIAFALTRLGDCHSFFQPPQSFPPDKLARFRAGWAELRDATSCPRVKPSPHQASQAMEGHAVEEAGARWAVVRVPECNADASAYVGELRAIVSRLAEGGPRGWVVDLRGNQGGNMWPMLAGIRSILGEGILGGFRDADGAVVEWTYRGGDGSGPPPQAEPTAGPLSPVAVLIDRGTASSGEAVAVAFRGRPRTRFFGERTRGLSTANEGYGLSDGAMLYVTTAVDCDRDGVCYPDGVAPDEAAPIGEALPAQYADLALGAALRWLRRP